MIVRLAPQRLWHGPFRATPFPRRSQGFLDGTMRDDPESLGQVPSRKRRRPHPVMIRLYHMLLSQLHSALSSLIPRRWRLSGRRLIRGLIPTCQPAGRTAASFPLRYFSEPPAPLPALRSNAEAVGASRDNYKDLKMQQNAFKEARLASLL